MDIRREKLEFSLNSKLVQIIRSKHKHKVIVRYGKNKFELPLIDDGESVRKLAIQIIEWVTGSHYTVAATNSELRDFADMLSDYINW